MLEDLKLYVVRNEKGQYYRGVYSGWDDDANAAKIYDRIGSARSAITSWVKYSMDKPCPVIVELGVVVTKEIDEVDRVDKVIQKDYITKGKMDQWRDLQRHVERLKKQNKELERNNDT